MTAAQILLVACYLLLLASWLVLALPRSRYLMVVMPWDTVSRVLLGAGYVALMASGLAWGLA